MPTTRPRYTVTDTGRVGEMLDLAEREWPEVSDRKELLLRLAAEGSDVVRKRLDEGDAARRRADQLRALERAPDLIDVELIANYAAWR